MREIDSFLLITTILFLLTGCDEKITYTPFDNITEVNTTDTLNETIIVTDSIQNISSNNTNNKVMECDTRDFYIGRCGQEYSYCKMRGYKMGNVTYSQDNIIEGICVDEHGINVGTIKDLMNLSKFKSLDLYESYCRKLGYQIETRKNERGQYSACIISEKGCDKNNDCIKACIGCCPCGTGYEAYNRGYIENLGINPKGNCTLDPTKGGCVGGGFPTTVVCIQSKCLITRIDDYMIDGAESEIKYQIWYERENKRLNFSHPYVKWLIDKKGNGTFNLHLVMEYNTSQEIVNNELEHYGILNYYKCWERDDECTVYLQITDFDKIKELFSYSFIKEIQIQQVVSDYKINISSEELKKCNADEDCTKVRMHCCGGVRVVNKEYVELWNTQIYCNHGYGCAAVIVPDNTHVKCQNNQCILEQYIP